MVDQLIQDLQTLRSRNALPGATPIHYIFAGPPNFDTLAGLSRSQASQLSATRVLRHLLAGSARWELSSYLLFDQGYLSASIDAGRQRAAHPDILPPGNTVTWRT